jgi:hypothetical protein
MCANHDIKGVIGHELIELRALGQGALRPAESEKRIDPFPRWVGAVRFTQPLAQCLNIFYVPPIVDVGTWADAQVHVRIIETRQNRFSLQVDDACPRADKPTDRSVASERGNATVPDCQSLDYIELGISSNDATAQEYDIGLRPRPIR